MQQHIKADGYDYFQQKRGKSLYWYRRPLGVDGACQKRRVVLGSGQPTDAPGLLVI